MTPKPLKAMEKPLMPMVLAKKNITIPSLLKMTIVHLYLRIFVFSIGSPFLGFLVVRSVGRWQTTTVVERERRNK